ncbi:MAG: DNA-directed RNA polymerase subunit alpha [Candidatus Omnitrophica bacterium]|nr:DNA-directed RNA polymerase subunit alpha [Candidatus Omnitrophota bacterium]
MDPKKLDFGLPKRIEWEESSHRVQYGKLIIEPLERGYGVTMGNAFRRVLLSSMPGVAITSVKIDGVAHEFSTIPGVKEDMIQIVLNLKQVALKSSTKNFPQIVRTKITKKREILASDLVSHSNLVALNPSLHIATLSKDVALNIELEISAGCGYLPAEKQKRSKIGVIPVSALFSPITKSAYHVENTRVGQRVDYEKLIMEVWTNGTIKPREAINYAANLLAEHFSIVEKQQALSQSIKELKLPTRVRNTLISAKIISLSDFISLSQEKLEKIKDLGEKSLEEIKKVRAKLGHPL